MPTTLAGPRSRLPLRGPAGGLLALALVALAARLLVVWLLWNPASAGNTYEHGEIARNLVEGRGFSVKFLGQEGPTSQQAPLYPALLALLYGIFGADSAAAVVAMQLLQCAAGTALALCVAWLGWSLAPRQRSLGWVAGCGAAVYPTHLYMVTHVQVALWAALLLTALLASAASKWLQGSWKKAATCGALAGLLLLVEPILAIALPIVALVYLQRELAGQRGLDQSPGEPRSNRAFAPGAPALALAGRCAVGVAVAALLVAPWIWRNARVHGELVFIKSTFGYAFWQGNNPLSWGTDKVVQSAAEPLRHAHDGSLADMDRALWAARRKTLYIDDVLLKPHGYREFAGLTEPARSRLLAARAWTFIAEHPRRYAMLCVNRLRYFLLFDETNPKAANRLYRATTAVWLMLSLVGALALRSEWRSLWPLWAIFAAVTLFHALTIVSARFRIPVEPLSFVWAAGAVAPLCLRLRPRRNVASPPPPAGFGNRHALQGPHRRSSRVRSRAYRL